MSDSPVSPTYSSGAALQRTAARPVRPSVSRRNSSSTNSTEITYWPLPPDVDAFQFIVRTLAEPAEVGIRLADCVTVGTECVRAVEHADLKMDEQKMFPGGKVVVQSGYFPGETAPTPLEVDVETEGEGGFTWGHLLSLIVREQIKVAVQGEQSAAAGDVGENGLPPLEHVWVVAIRRSTDTDGTFRYFPELEVRLPSKQLREDRVTAV